VGFVGIDFASVTEAFDTSLPTGRLLMHLVSAMGEFEKAILVEQVKAGA
jgi:DNA invertase Pin-like site-specific DNA recombinase